MAYEDFLAEFAATQGVGTKEDLLSKHAERYSFQINSRERAKKLIELLGERAGIGPSGLRILDIGCAYGSFTIEFAKRGADVVGVDVSDKWLRLAGANARNEVEATFVKCDASTRKAIEILSKSGPFDLFIVNDVFEHIYDTVGLIKNIRAMSSDRSKTYFKVPNGQATRHVLQEGHKKIFGISMLAPDYWTEFVSAPFQIYYRRWEHYESIIKSMGFDEIEIFNEVTDPSLEATRRFITNDLTRIRAQLKPDNFENPKQFSYLRTAYGYYEDEALDDLKNLGWEALFFKYRVTFWEGMFTRTA